MIKKYLQDALGLDVISILSHKEGSGNCIDVTCKMYGGTEKTISVSTRVFTYWCLNQELLNE